MNMNSITNGINSCINIGITNQTNQLHLGRTILTSGHDTMNHQLVSGDEHLGVFNESIDVLVQEVVLPHEVGALIDELGSIIETTSLAEGDEEAGEGITESRLLDVDNAGSSLEHGGVGLVEDGSGDNVGSQEGGGAEDGVGVAELEEVDGLAVAVEEPEEICGGGVAAFEGEEGQVPSHEPNVLSSDVG